jgi:hypothetical protein
MYALQDDTESARIAGVEDPHNRKMAELQHQQDMEIQRTHDAMNIDSVAREKEFQEEKLEIVRRYGLLRANAQAEEDRRQAEKDKLRKEEYEAHGFAAIFATVDEERLTSAQRELDKLKTPADLLRDYKADLDSNPNYDDNHRQQLLQRRFAELQGNPNQGLGRFISDSGDDRWKQIQSAAAQGGGDKQTQTFDKMLSLLERLTPAVERGLLG